MMKKKPPGLPHSVQTLENSESSSKKTTNLYPPNKKKLREIIYQTYVNSKCT